MNSSMGRAMQCINQLKARAVAMAEGWSVDEQQCDSSSVLTESASNNENNDNGDEDDENDNEDNDDVMWLWRAWWDQRGSNNDNDDDTTIKYLKEG